MFNCSSGRFFSGVQQKWTFSFPSFNSNLTLKERIWVVRTSIFLHPKPDPFLSRPEPFYLVLEPFLPPFFLSKNSEVEKCCRKPKSLSPRNQISMNRPSIFSTLPTRLIPCKLTFFRGSLSGTFPSNLPAPELFRIPQTHTLPFTRLFIKFFTLFSHVPPPPPLTPHTRTPFHSFCLPPRLFFYFSIQLLFFYDAHAYTFHLCPPRFDRGAHCPLSFFLRRSPPAATAATFHVIAFLVPFLSSVPNPTALFPRY